MTRRKPKPPPEPPAVCGICGRNATVDTVSPSVRLCSECDRAVRGGHPPEACDAKGCVQGRVAPEKADPPRCEDCGEACACCAGGGRTKPCYQCKGRGFVYPGETP